jgi:SAM-dependent methyltransferase
LPESPWALPPHLLSRAVESPRETPSRRAALAALPGSVLDVGCGAGAASLPLVPPATEITGVDESDDMLAAFAELAAKAGVPAHTLAGTWPEVANDVAPADVVVCHHVVYNVGDVEPFLRALHDHAKRRVVLELYSEHPRAWLNPLWRAFWNLERPARPTAQDFEEVVRELGYDVRVERFETGSPWGDLDEMVPWVRRWLCLQPGKDADLRAALALDPPPRTRRIVTMWWDA